MLNFKTLENTSLEEITLAFNEAFSNYFFPIVFTKEMFASKFATEGGRLDLSVGAFEEDNLVAFIFHFIDDIDGKTSVYNGGTGVIESHRGKGLTSRMYDFVLPKLKEAKVDRMQLEVLTQNDPAIAVYEKQGFQIRRELWCFSGSLKTRNCKLPEGYVLDEITSIDWDLLETFWDYAPTWQNSISTLKNLEQQTTTVVVKHDDELVGYVICNLKQKRIHQLAVAKTHRKLGIGSRLLNHLHTLEKGKFSMINIDTRMDGMKHLLECHGLENFGNQYEMDHDN